MLVYISGWVGWRRRSWVGGWDVPVLSEQMSVTEPRDSRAVRRRTMTLQAAIFLTPKGTGEWVGGWVDGEE